MRSIALLPLLAITSLVGSQNIDPTSVPLATRDSWCTDQTTTCPLLCTQETNSATTYANDCSPSTLQWDCVCKNGLSPNVSQYSLTIPYHECQEWGNQCVAACPISNSACAQNCRTQYTCGANNPTRVNATTSSSATAAGSTSTSTGGQFGSFGGSGSSTGGKSAASSLFQIGQLYGMGAVAAGIFAGFTLLL